jgi:arylsulfatase A-like enzyme
MREEPNIVLVTSHDTGRHLGCYGVETVNTPRLDALAADGVRFGNYFTTSPVCSPSRGAAMTGRYPQANGLMGLVHNPWLWKLNPDERHLAALLREGGYESVLFNVQHETRDWERLGFERRFDCRKREQGRVTAVDTAETFRDYLARRGAPDRPLYAQIGFFETHTPFDFAGAEPDDSRGVFVPPRLVADGNSRAHMAALQGVCRVMDGAVGTILDALEANGMVENTLVIYTTDHGIEAARDKWFCFDPGIGISLIMRWPAGGIAGGRVPDELVSSVGLAPTLLEIAGLEVPENMQGRSFAQLATGGDYTADDAIFAIFQGKNARCVRTGRHKLIMHFSPYRELVVPVNIARRETIFHSSPLVQLYDLEADPEEFENLAESPEHAGVRTELLDRLFAWMESVDDPLLREPPRTPFYDMAIELYREGRT